MFKKLLSIALAMIMTVSTVTNVLASESVFSARSSTEYAFCIGTDYRGGLDGQIDTSNDAIYAADCFEIAGYKSYYNTSPTVSYITGNSTNGKKRLENAVVFLSGHGDQTSMQFNWEQRGGQYATGIRSGTSGESNGYTYLGVGDCDMSDTKLFILAGCETAMGMYNITRDIVDAGAEAAIGWMTTVMQGSHTNWLERFCDKLAVGYTVKEAKNYADSYIYIDSKDKNGYIYGNTSTVITSSSSTYALNYSNRQTSVSDDREIQLDNNINAISELTEGSLEDKIVSALSINGIDINIQDFKIVQTGSIIDLIYLVNGAETECGYTIFTDGGEVTDIYNNMNSYNQVSTFSLRDDNLEVEVTDDMKQEYFNCSAEKLNVDYIVIEQSGKVIYDTDSNTYYYCVITDYQVNSSGAYGSVGDYYEIN